jgi:integrase
LYLLPSKQENKARNDETMALANAVKCQRIMELQNETHDFSNSKNRAKTNLSDYIEKVANKRKERAVARAIAKGKNAKKKTGGYSTFMNMRHHLKQYKGDKITFQQVDKAFCIGFIEYLRTVKSKRIAKAKNGEKERVITNLSMNTQLDYLNKLKTVLNDAVAEDIILANPINKIRREDKPKGYIAEIEYLTNQELNTLAKTPLKAMPMLKRAFLFSCYTGLRYCDVTSLTWGCLRKNDNGRTLIKFVQDKTQKSEYPPISEKAVRWLPERGTAKDTDFVFKLSASGYINELLRDWAELAGINKWISFHVSRHTAATLLLSWGVAVTTVQKILGHSDIRTTLRYAKVIDKNVLDAVEILDNLPDAA